MHHTIVSVLMRGISAARGSTLPHAGTHTHTQERIDTNINYTSLWVETFTSVSDQKDVFFYDVDNYL